MGLDVPLIGEIPSGLGAFAMAVPIMPPIESLPSLSASVFLIYAMTSTESLLSCAALEKMKKTSYKHSADQELIGQGLANMGSAFFMGMPVTSVIARSGLNVRLNAATRLPSLVQSGFVFSSVVFMSSTIAMIPMPALSGMLITTGMGMLNPAELKHCMAVQKNDVIPFATTVAGMLAFGLAEGIGIGCLSALALNHDYGRLAVREVPMPQLDTTTNNHSAHEPTTIWKLQGPINFTSMFEIDRLMQRIQDEQERHQAADQKSTIVLDAGGVTSVEFSGVEELIKHSSIVTRHRRLRTLKQPSLRYPPRRLRPRILL